MPVGKRIISAFGKRAERLRLVLLALAVFLCGWSLCARATDVSVLLGRAGMTSWQVEVDALSSVVAATETDATLARGVVSRVAVSGTSMGTIAATELSTVGMADIAMVVARSVNPALIALTVGALAVQGIQRCMSSGTGWCQRAPVNSSTGDTGYDGWQYTTSGQVFVDSPSAACQKQMSLNDPQASFLGIVDAGGGNYYCKIKQLNGDIQQPYLARRSGDCASGLVLSNGQCVVDPSKPVSWLPAGYPDVAAAWNKQMAGNPMGVRDYWSSMTPDERAAAEQNAKQQPAKINGSDTVSNPNVKTDSTTQTKPDGTLQTCTTVTGARVQARPNTSATAPTSPLNYNTTTTATTTCPDGTSTRTTNQDSGDTGTSTQSPASGVAVGGGGATKVEVKSCGLADTAPCKMDESGTPTYAEPGVAKDKMDNADAQLKGKLNDIEGAKSDQFGIVDVIKPMQGTCSSFSYAVPKATGVDSMDIDICPTIDATRDVVTWLWIIVSAMVCVLLVRDAINGA